MHFPWRNYLPEKTRQKLLEKENLVRIALNSFWLVSDRIVRMVVALIVGAWTARYLGAEKFGIFNNALAYATIFASLATLGIDSIVIRDLVKHPEKRNEYLGTAFYLKLAAGVFTYLLALLGALMFYGNYSPEYRYLIYIIAAGTIFQSFDVIDYYFQSIVKSKYTVLARNSMFLLVNAYKVYLIVSGSDLVLFAWAWLLELLLIALALVYVYNRKGFAVKEWTWNRSLAWQLVTESWSLYIAYISSYIYMRIDQVMISKLVPDAGEAGRFAASTKLYEIPFFVIIALTSSFYPSLIHLHKKDEKMFYKRYTQVTSFYSLLGLIIFAGTLLFGEFAIHLLFGTKYEGTFPILSIQIAGMLFMFNAGLRSSYLTIISRQKIIMITSLLSAGLNIGLNWFLIPLWQAKGAALATAITQCVSLLLLNVAFPDTRRLFIIQIKSLFLLNIKDSLGLLGRNRQAEQ